MWRYILLLLLVTACVAPTPSPTPTPTPTATLPEVKTVSKLPGAPTEVTIQQPEFSENKSVDLGSVI